jgi:iron complex outermembrane receptor protein
MTRVRSAIACAFAALFATPALLAAQGTIEGRVSSEGAGLTRATVTVEGTTLRAMSDERGEYAIRGVPAGTHTVRVRLIGYVPQTARLSVAGATVRLDFELIAQPIGLSPIDIVVGSRARHTAADELAVPVDVFESEDVRSQGTTEAAAILAALAPSVNFPRQSIADATDIVRPFTLRGLSPDETLVLVNGRRRHRTALVHVFGAALGAGSSGVDLNALPASAIERIEVLRDGAAAQYGSDAIAGVVNVVMRSGAFAPTVTVDYGGYVTGDFPDDGRTVTASGGWGFNLLGGSVSLFGEYRDRRPTNRAGADDTDQIVPGDADAVDPNTNTVVTKNNPVPQPNYHWGDGASEDYLGFANLAIPLVPNRTAEVYAFGGYSFRNGTGNGFRRNGLDDRNWPAIYPLGFLPEFDSDSRDWSASGGVRGVGRGWTYDAGVTVGQNRFRYDIDNSLNVSLGPCLDIPCAPGLDGQFGTADDPNIPNQTSFFAGELRLGEVTATFDARRSLGSARRPTTLALGGTYRRDTYRIIAGEPASYLQGGYPNQYGDAAPPGSQVFPGFQPANEVDVARDNYGVYLDVETNLTERFLANLAARFESYSDFGERVTWKAAARLQASSQLILRAAFNTGFRAPALSQSWFGSTITNFAPDPVTGAPEPFEVGIFPVSHPVARILGAEPLREETSDNFSGGFAFSPTANFTLTADLYHIRIDDRILMTAELSGPDVEALLSAAGQNAQAARYMTNALETSTTGLDITARYARALSNGRRFEVDAAINYTKTEVTDSTPLPPQLAAIGVGRFDVLLEGGLNAIERERPEWRGTLTGRYATPRWSAMLRGSHYGGFASSLVDYSALQEYSFKILFDAELGYNFRPGLNLAVGARNLLDTYPDRTIRQLSYGIMQYPTASPFGFNGRFLYVRAEWQAL